MLYAEAETLCIPRVTLCVGLITEPDRVTERPADCVAERMTEPERVTDPERITDAERMTDPERVTEPERMTDALFIFEAEMEPIGMSLLTIMPSCCLTRAGTASDPE